jgi:pyrrolidone-carboxylate peptidase
MNVLYTAFKGKTNSSKILLDYVVTNNKLYLTNSFKTSVLELQNELKKNNYDLIISFGQAPLGIDVIKIETSATDKLKYVTNYDYDSLYNKLKDKYKVIISNDAGNYLCNNIYYKGLEYITINNLKSKMIFIHIPKKKNINDIEKLSMVFNDIEGEIYEK